MKRFVTRIVDFSGAHPLIVLFVALLTLVSTWTYASKLELRSDFLELLPRDSPGFKAFEHQLGRVGGGASLLVIVESPDRKANEKVIDDLTAKLLETKETNKKCHAACKDDKCNQACGADL
ncbi:MAG: exporters of the superfamily, partial [Myxococcaceae bacterium]|nr:exporters of the superfamily [Myxococcaceae bacterium]